jgi:hypothetical protein
VTLKIAVLAPTPSAIVIAAVKVKIGLFRSARNPNAKSRNRFTLPPAALDTASYYGAASARPAVSNYFGHPVGQLATFSIRER